MDARRIAGLRALADLPAAELDELAAAMSEHEIEADTELITHGKDGYLIYFVEQGMAEVLTDDGEVARMLGPGDVFGEIAVLHAGQRTATVIARTRMILAALFEFDFERIRPRLPEFERSLRRLAAERLGDEAP
jgi:CRP-like cAMP-binding protein